MVQRPTQQTSGKVVDLKPKPKEAVRPHIKVSIEDINWLRLQPPCIQQLWLDCAAVEQFGCQQRELKSSLSSKSFRLAKAALQEQGLFHFEATTEVSPSGRSRIISWKVENLHGYYLKRFWEVLPASGEVLPPERENLPASGEVLPPERENLPDVAAEIPTMTEVENFQPRLNYMPTTHQLPTKVVGGVVIPSQETEPPLGGAPTMRDGMPEEEKEVSDRSLASLEDQAEAAGREPRDLGGGNFSAAPPLSANFPIQVGDTVTLDWPDSPFHGRIGTVQCVDIEVRAVDIRFNGLAFDATLPIGRLFRADPPASPDQLLAGQLNDAASLTASDNSNLVGEICDFALTHDCRLEDSDKEEMGKLNSKQLEKVLEVFQKQIAQHSCFSKTTKRDRFLFALSMGRHSLA